MAATAARQDRPFWARARHVEPFSPGAPPSDTHRAMGYDVHLVRTEDWVDAKSDPITRADVDAIIAADRTLSWSTTDYVEMSDDDGSVKRYYAINWNGASVFWWFGAEVRCKNPSKSELLKLVELAGALRARVVGDDGERYERGKNLFGGAKLVARR
jgi:hypothetical protein